MSNNLDFSYTAKHVLFAWEEGLYKVLMHIVYVHKGSSCRRWDICPQNATKYRRFYYKEIQIIKPYVYTASILVPVSDGMHAHHVHVTNARHANACAHIPRFYSVVLSCVFKRAEANTSSSVTQIHLPLYTCPSTCSRSWWNRASLSKIVQCISYNLMNVDPSRNVLNKSSNFLRHSFHIHHK